MILHTKRPRNSEYRILCRTQNQVRDEPRGNQIDRRLRRIVERGLVMRILVAIRLIVGQGKVPILILPNEYLLNISGGSPFAEISSLIFFTAVVCVYGCVGLVSLGTSTLIRPCPPSLPIWAVKSAPSLSRGEKGPY